MRALRLPTHAFPVTYLVRFRVPHGSSAVRARLAALPCGRRSPHRTRIVVQPVIPSPAHSSCGREWELSGSQVTHPVPLPRSRIPAESAAPRHRETVPSMMPPQHRTRRLRRTFISRPPRGFSTCCLRFKNDVATIPARRASGWLASLYREGVEPSGSR